MLNSSHKKVKNEEMPLTLSAASLPGYTSQTGQAARLRLVRREHQDSKKHPPAGGRKKSFYTEINFYKTNFRISQFFHPLVCSSPGLPLSNAIGFKKIIFVELKKIAIPEKWSLLSRKFVFNETSFTNLMKKRIYHVLLIASNYDAFTLEDNGRIDEQIF